MNEGDTMFQKAIRRLAVSAGGTVQAGVARLGIRVMDSQAVREIASLDTPVNYQRLQNRDGTMNR